MKVLNGVKETLVSDKYVLLNDDCLNALKELPDNSIDSIVTDPPYGFAFMGKKWDYELPSIDIWKECLRVLKPGGHLLAFGGPRTYHRLACGIEDAGFEIRDQLQWLFGSGFPKSLNVAKAGAGEEWQGWGTALKPANEPICLARKPFSESTVAKNVLKWGTGALNIDACRVELKKGDDTSRPVLQTQSWKNTSKAGVGSVTDDRKKGRFPANLVLSHSEHCTDDACDLFTCPVKQLDEQSGHLHGSGNKSDTSLGKDKGYNASGYKIAYAGRAKRDYGSQGGGASRFFYCAKVSSSERNMGCADLKEKVRSEARPNSPDNTGKFPDHDGRVRAGNNHPTVKPIKLMSYLCRLITPPNGVVLDPFMGSGSTGMAALREGFKFLGIEREKEYFEIAEKRILFIDKKDKSAA